MPTTRVVRGVSLMTPQDNFVQRVDCEFIDYKQKRVLIGQHKVDELIKEYAIKLATTDDFKPNKESAVIEEGWDYYKGEGFDGYTVTIKSSHGVHENI